MPSSVLGCRETCLQAAFSDCTFLATFLATCAPTACNERRCHQSNGAPQTPHASTRRPAAALDKMPGTRGDQRGNPLHDPHWGQYRDAMIHVEV